MIQQMLQQLDRLLSTQRPDYYQLLQPGATDADLDAFEAQFALSLPQAFRHLYQWRSGQDPLLLDEMIDIDVDPRYWRRGWVPFLHNGGGSYLCLDLIGVDGGQQNQLIGFWKQDLDRPVEFESLEAWLADLVNVLISNATEST